MLNLKPKKMKLANTKDNNVRVKVLKTVKQTQWAGEITHDTLDKCLTVINLFHSPNSGLYIPTAIKIKGLTGIFMINKDGSLHFESRILKISDSSYKIEHLTNDGYNQFESKYSELI